LKKTWRSYEAVVEFSMPESSLLQKASNNRSKVVVININIPGLM
jgi:hypothetical protein